MKKCRYIFEDIFFIIVLCAPWCLLELFNVPESIMIHIARRDTDA